MASPLEIGGGLRSAGLSTASRTGASRTVMRSVRRAEKIAARGDARFRGLGSDTLLAAATILHSPMRTKGINYDTGFISAGTTTHEPFDPEVVRREMRVIHDDLHCTAVRITGGNPDRLEIAAAHAADAG